MGYHIKFSPPDISEEEIAEVADTLRSGWITTGPKTKRFEKEIADYCGTSYAVCLNSATAGMELTLRLLGVGPGDEVITSAYTYTASCSVICHVGATPVLVDTAPESFEMDEEKLRQAITKRTKVIIPVDLGGIMCDYDKIFEIIKEKQHLFSPSTDLQKRIGRITVLADAAHAFGATYHGRRCGSVADFTSFSFHAVKNLTTAEGGAVTWTDKEGLSNEEIYRQFMLLSLHGQSKDALQKTQKGNWEYDILSPAYKCNMTDIMASIGLVQLRRYPQLLKRRREIIEAYNKGLENEKVTVLDHYNERGISSGHLYLVRLTGKSEAFRNQMIAFMEDHGVSVNVHYKPLPMHTAYRKLGFSIKDYPNAFHMYENEITLPLHTLLIDDEVQYVIEQFKQCLHKK